LSGTYSQSDVREFVHLCYLLALPLIRRRIAQGRIDLASLGLQQTDVVYDSMAGIFIRDGAGHFTELEKFFSKEAGNTKTASDELLLDTLRRILFGCVNNSLIRLHGDADPVFGKILHNVDVTIARTQYFEKFTRFGDSMLACCEADLLPDRPPVTIEYLREQLARIVLVHDSMPVMLKKLHGILEGQDLFQRTVPLLWVASLLKDIYSMGTESEPEQRSLVLDPLEMEDALRLIERVCSQLRVELHPHYVDRGGTSDDLFEVYLKTTSEILSDLVSCGRDGQKHFFDYLSQHMPELGKEEYISRHKPILEYFVKVAKQKLGRSLTDEHSASGRM
ncbi:MAG TPA: hypothetical protein VMH23_06525, partial [Bacteroidota bacterium]|nr:hypothetical protein [Bacteroidota bacterium]